MNYSINNKLPPFETLLAPFPLKESTQKEISKHRAEIVDILSGKDQRLLMIIGPCSAWPSVAVLEYANRLKKISDQVNDYLKIVMRVYIQKPRTIKGWAGPMHQPDPIASPDIEKGLQYTREMMLKIAELGLPLADEALFMHQIPGFLELLSWVAIGARSSENPVHRIFASSLNFAVGMKNPTHGTLAVSVHNIVAAQSSHVTLLNNHEIKTFGNPNAHVVLRGSNRLPNYSNADLQELKQHMDNFGIQNPGFLIDVSHDNCFLNGKKQYQLQPKIIFQILEDIKNEPSLRYLLKGFMVESFLKNGNQNIQDPLDLGGLSITDPCLGWEETEQLLLELADKIANETNSKSCN